MTATEALARMYADKFIERFELIDGKWDEPLITPSRFPQQNIAGNAYKGCNRSFLPVVASFHKFRLPLWMTAGQIQDLDIRIRKGESGSPVSFTELYIKDMYTGKRSSVTIDEYDAMEKNERKERNLAKIFRVHWYKVFNIEQTTFSESYPATIQELHKAFGASDGREINSGELDRMVSGGSWLCPIRTTGASEKPRYDRNDDIILIPGKHTFSDDRSYYGTLLRLMARSTGSELRLDRGIWSDLKGDTAKEALVSELCAASMGALLGLGVTMDRNSESYLKSWIMTIDAEPSFIYEAVKEASRASECLTDVLGIKLPKGVDITKVLSEQYAGKAAEAAKKRELRVSRNKDTVRIGKKKQTRHPI